MPDIEKKREGSAPVGYEFAPFEFLVTLELNQQYCYAQEDFNPRYLEETKEGPPMVHPGLLLNMSNSTRSPSYHIEPGAGGLHARDETFFLHPARVGKKLRVTWKVVEKYEKRGRPYNRIETHVHDEDGVEILRRFSHGTVATKEFEAQKKR